MRGSRLRRPFQEPAIWLSLLVVSACSTLAPVGAAPGCASDDDCDAGEVCLLDQGGVCLAPSVPPRRPELGLDVAEGETFHIEFRGCDAEIDPIDGVLRTDKREQLSALARLSAITDRPIIDCSSCTEGECIGGSLCRSSFRGDFALSQSSRFGRPQLKSGSESYPPVDGELMELDEPVIFDWPRHVSTDEAADLPVVLELSPENVNLARIRRELAPPASSDPRDFEITARLDCQRTVSASVRRIGANTGIEEASVAFFFNEEVASLATTLGVELDELPACTETSECSTGHACALPAGRCVLNLFDTQASRDAPSDPDGNVLVPIYNYCEGALITSRELRVEVTPPEGSGLPTMQYYVSQPFAMVAVDSPVTDLMPGDLCMPAWAAPGEIALSYTGAPVKLLETTNGEYVCCTDTCLPTVLEDKAPSTATECAEIPLTLELQAQMPAPDEDVWDEDGCLLPIDGSPGTYSATKECGMGECSVLASSGDTGEEATGLAYRAKLVSPVGSVFRSQTIDVVLEAGMVEFEAVELKPRVVLRGTVTCDPQLGENCVPEDVAVVAERIRQDGDGDPPPPYFFPTASLPNGDFTLLLDPGVYVVTAIPDRGSLAGPGEYRVLDLRSGSAIVDTVAGVPIADISTNPMVLKGGVPVVLRLRDFAPGGRVEPIDLGSWKYQTPALADPAGVELDLNDPATCYSGGASDRGCAVRDMIRPNVAGILASISNSVDFTMREEGNPNCPPL